MHPARLRELRRWYFLGIAVALALLVVIRFFVIGATTPSTPQLVQVTGQVVDNLIATTIAAFLIAVLLVWLLPAGDESPPLELIDSQAIETTLEKMSSSTREWRNRARTGSYFRSQTLQWLAEQSTKQHADTWIYIQLMDPCDEKLRQSYTRYLGRVPGAAQTWDEARVHHEIYATIVTLLAMRTEYPRLRVELRLSSSFWVSSLDISQSHILVTGQYRGHPAISHRTGTAFYNTLLDEFSIGWDQSRPIDLSSVTCPPRAKLGINDLKAALMPLGVGADDLADSALKNVLKHIQQPKHRYA